MNQLTILVMAAGKGTRLKSSLPKVLHQLGGQSLIEYVLDAAQVLNPREITVIVGHQAELVRSELRHREVQFVEQVPQLGTGHAVQVARRVWQQQEGNLLILSGDVPLISSETLEKLVQTHNHERPSATMLSARMSNPFGYGRVVRSPGGQVLGIVEHKDASPEELAIEEINTGLYCFQVSDLAEVIDKLSADNRQSEYYLTDAIKLLSSKGKRIEAALCDDLLEITGINSRIELAELGQVLRDRRTRKLMSEGVTVIDPASTYVENDVRVGSDTIIYPNVYLQKGTIIGSGCQIHSNCRLSHTVVGDQVVILDSCLITDSRLPAGVEIGPFAQLKNQVVDETG